MPATTPRTTKVTSIFQRLSSTLPSAPTVSTSVMFSSRPSLCRSPGSGAPLTPVSLDQLTGVCDVPPTGRPEHDRLQVGQAADPLDRLLGVDRPGGEDRHRDGPEGALVHRLSVGVDAPRHPEPELVDVGAHQGVDDPDRVERVE